MRNSLAAAALVGMSACAESPKQKAFETMGYFENAAVRQCGLQPNTYTPDLEEGDLSLQARVTKPLLSPVSYETATGPTPEWTRQETCIDQMAARFAEGAKMAGECSVSPGFRSDGPEAQFTVVDRFVLSVNVDCADGYVQEARNNQ